VSCLEYNIAVKRRQRLLEISLKRALKIDEREGDAESQILCQSIIHLELPQASTAMRDEHSESSKWVAGTELNGN